MESQERRKLTPQQAQELLPDGDTVHTFRISGAVLVGADWAKSRIIQRFNTNGVELSGAFARKINHGIASFDEANGWLFIETRTEPPSKA